MCKDFVEDMDLFVKFEIMAKTWNDNSLVRYILSVQAFLHVGGKGEIGRD